jgi:hypothetical protein
VDPLHRVRAQVDRAGVVVDGGDRWIVARRSPCGLSGTAAACPAKSASRDVPRSRTEWVSLEHRLGEVLASPTRHPTLTMPLGWRGGVACGADPRGRHRRRTALIKAGCLFGSLTRLALLCRFQERAKTLGVIRVLISSRVSDWACARVRRSSSRAASRQCCCRPEYAVCASRPLCPRPLDAFLPVLGGYSEGIGSGDAR